MTQPPSNIVNYHAEVYYSGVYWNDYAYVWQHLNERLSGDPHKHWFKHFHEKLHGRKFKKALVLCCGNGWVERELLEYGLFEEAVGVEFAAPLLEEARAAATGLPLRYYQMDINSAVFPESDYDIVINYAAAHHIAYIDRVFREIAQILPEDGYFVSLDYVGPHRNQYPLMDWVMTQRLNQSLPAHMQQNLSYPHLPTMLVLDPTEAIHSELILPVIRRYFEIEEHKHLGGARAYPILTHNTQFRSASQTDQLFWLDHLMQADTTYLAAFPDSSLFDYIVARPAKDVFREPGKIAAWTDEELLREELAAQHGGIYYTVSSPPVDIDAAYITLMEECLWRRATMDDLLRERDWLMERNNELERSVAWFNFHPVIRLLRTLKQRSNQFINKRCDTP